MHAKATGGLPPGIALLSRAPQESGSLAAHQACLRWVADPLVSLHCARWVVAVPWPLRLPHKQPGRAHTCLSQCDVSTVRLTGAGLHCCACLSHVLGKLDFNAVGCVL